ncbi:hypothetical protein POM88_019875 [Heracleum sosnowskyi]|uniref:Transducin/WD40 repeat-like superfamily protein n=1 Tax=Heracleum sosnowskyi TaxID=360622 RepID=A0AAD8MMK0_9APIA|nr:hypothetical protein POM88_019875 [Heracleum sosnowskyi]
MSLELPPNASHNFLAMIFCFKLKKGLCKIDYSVKNITSDFIWSDTLSRTYGYESLMKEQWLDRKGELAVKEEDEGGELVFVEYWTSVGKTRRLKTEDAAFVNCQLFVICKDLPSEAGKYYQQSQLSSLLVSICYFTSIEFHFSMDPPKSVLLEGLICIFITGGLDSNLILWDFSKGRPLKILDFGNPDVHARGDAEFQKLICSVSSSNAESQDQSQEKKLNLDYTSGGYTAAVSCVTLCTFGDKGQYIISGANDKPVKAWNWSPHSDPRQTSNIDSLLHLDIILTRKVNGLCTASSDSENLIVL